MTKEFIAVLLLTGSFLSVSPRCTHVAAQNPPRADFASIAIADRTTSREDIEAQRQAAAIEADAIALAKMLWGEARGCTYEDKRNCCITVCNRVEEGRWYGSTVIECVTAFYGTDDQQYHGYSPNNPVIDELYQIALEVLKDWETHTNWNNYNCFSGYGGCNHFYRN